MSLMTRFEWDEIKSKINLTAGVLKKTSWPKTFAFDLVSRLPAKIWSKVDLPVRWPEIEREKC